MTNTVVGALLGCQLMRMDEWRSLWFRADVISLVTGIPEFCVERRMWAARTVDESAWPWSRVKVSDRQIVTFLPDLIEQCMWVFPTHAAQYMRMDLRLVQKIVARGEIRSDVREFRNPFYTSHKALFVEDIIEVDGVSRVKRLMGRGCPRDLVDSFVLLSPELLGRLKMTGKAYRL